MIWFDLLALVAFFANGVYLIFICLPIALASFVMAMVFSGVFAISVFSSGKIFTKKGSKKEGKN